MATNNSATAAGKRFRRAVIANARAAGITRCPICGVTLDYTRARTPASAEADHIQPVSLGGSNSPENGRVLCRRCNQSRGNGTRGARRQAARARSVTTLAEW